MNLNDLHTVLNAADNWCDYLEYNDREGEVTDIGPAIRRLRDALSDSATDDVEVLVSGDPFDGLTIEGPYPAGTLADCDIHLASPWWIVDLAKPSIETE